ncbi:hypothetical protein ScPMuIL_004993 [Solemya velum]
MNTDSRNGIVIFVLCGTVAGLLFYNADGRSMVKLIVKALLFLGFLTFIMQYVGVRVIRRIKRWRTSNKSPKDTYDSVRERHLQSKQQEAVNKIQDQHDEKASSYKERILIPREDARNKKKEEEHQRFLGPAWKGKGDKLGGEEIDQGVKSVGSSKDAVKHRKLPEVVTRPIVKPEPKPVIPKKVIVLPDEPAEGTADSVTVSLRTPLGGVKHRRFLQSHTVQTVLDFMTTIGHSQMMYTLATSYPRRVLSDSSNQTLSQLDFRGRVTLNIEEREK